MFHLTEPAENSLLFEYHHGILSSAGFVEHLNATFADHVVSTPQGDEWWRMGFAPPVNFTDALAVQPEGQESIVLCLEVRSRILPGDNLREACRARVAKIESRESRKLHKNELAQIRDEVEGLMLPTCLVKTSRVLCHIDPKRLIIFTSSTKVAEDCCHIMRRALGTLPVNYCTEADAMERVLTACIRDGFVTDERETARLIPCRAATLERMRGSKAPRATFKDIDLGDELVTQYLDDGYACTKLTAQFFTNDPDVDDDESAYLLVTISDKGTVTGIKLSDGLSLRVENDPRSDGGDEEDDARQRELAFAAEWCIAGSQFCALWDFLRGLQLSYRAADRVADSDGWDDQHNVLEGGGEADAADDLEDF